MTKRHCIVLAETLRSLRPESESEALMIFWKRTVVAVAFDCERFNVRFNRSLFLKACGYQTEEKA